MHWWHQVIKSGTENQCLSAQLLKLDIIHCADSTGSTTPDLRVYCDAWHWNSHKQATRPVQSARKPRTTENKHRLFISTSVRSGTSWPGWVCMKEPRWIWLTESTDIGNWHPVSRPTHWVTAADNTRRNYQQHFTHYSPVMCSTMLSFLTNLLLLQSLADDSLA